MHPDIRSLMAYLDGELKPHLSRKIALHLERCPECRHEADAIEAGMDWLLLLDSVSCPVDGAARQEGLEKVLDAARQWRESVARGKTPDTSHRRGELETRLAELLETYFGVRIAGSVQGAHGGRASLGAQIAAAESLLTAFLGQRAAAVLMQELQSRQKLRQSLAGEPT